MSDQPQPQQPDASTIRLQAGQLMMGVLDAADDEFIAEHARLTEEIAQFGLLLAQKGMPPWVVLGQMQQLVAAAFVAMIMPRYIAVAVRDPEPGEQP